LAKIESIAGLQNLVDHSVNSLGLHHTSLLLVYTVWKKDRTNSLRYFNILMMLPWSVLLKR